MRGTAADLSTGSRIAVRLLRPHEVRAYLDIVARAVRGLAATHYPPETVEAWAPTLDDSTLHDVEANTDGEIRLIAELNGVPAGIGALVVEGSELRACYVVPEAARCGCGSAIVREVERIARAQGLTRLELAASLNSEPFYTSLGYRVRERSAVTLRNGHQLACVWMEKQL